MRDRGRFSGAVLGAVASVAGVALVCSTLATVAAQADPPSGGDEYVAMGDSFAAGPGIAPQSGGACARSGKNYAALLAADLGAHLTDASCSGAQTKDFATSQNGDNPPQYDALGPETTLVTLGTIGGNDVGLVNLAQGCVLATCPAAGDMTPQAIAALEPTLVGAIQQVKSRAPAAEIVVVGYGTYIPPSGCAALPGVEPGEAVWLQAQIDHLSDVLKAAAAQEEVTFADMRTIPRIAEHTVCAAPDKQWLRGLNTYGDGAPMHPSTRGMANWAQRLKQVVQAMRGEPVDPWVEITAGPTAPTPPSGPSNAQQAAAAAKTLRFKVSCSSRRSGQGKVTLRVRGGAGAVRKVVFRVGRWTLAKDRKPGFKASARVKKVSAHRKARRGKVSATVTLRVGSVSQTRVLRHKRPGCLR